MLSAAYNPFFYTEKPARKPAPPTDKPPDQKQDYFEQSNHSPQSSLNQNQQCNSSQQTNPEQCFFPYMKQSLQPEIQSNVVQPQFIQKPGQIQQQLNLQLPDQQGYQQQFQQQMSQETLQPVSFSLLNSYY